MSIEQTASQTETISHYTSAIKCVRCKGVDLVRMRWAAEREGPTDEPGEGGGKGSQRAGLLSWSLEC